MQEHFLLDLLEYPVNDRDNSLIEQVCSEVDVEGMRWVS